MGVAAAKGEYVSHDRWHIGICMLAKRHHKLYRLDYLIIMFEQQPMLIHQQDRLHIGVHQLLFHRNHCVKDIDSQIAPNKSYKTYLVEITAVQRGLSYNW